MGTEGENHNDKFGPKDIYKHVLDTRNFEISLFWQRSNYFLVLNTAIALGFFQIKDKEFVYSVALAGLGVWFSYLWYKVCLGAKFWQDRWENRLKEIELMFIKDKLMPENMKLFSAEWKDIYADVEASIKHSEHKGLRRVFDGFILKKPSVSFAMITLSYSFFIGWLVLLILFILFRICWLTTG